MAVVSIGPFGGRGGREWSCMFSGGLKRIIVSYESCIHSLVFQDSSGTFSQKFGSDNGFIGGCQVKEVLIDWPNEYLVSLSGRLGSHGRARCTVKYLVFQTNARSYSFGVEHRGDTSFSIPIKSGVIVGFHGRSGLLVDSIGLHVAPINPVPQVQAPQIQESKIFAPFRPKRSSP
ncbi:Mannose/glucose-specific lectin [Morella rubra]|uniref:Mannose/glucose-specific lectin n=1 Tax=Morella rubra TaxID=262757 RepID=A0A6A1W6R4_9ROSI|nr:Mannose/glucose-specific lectin [Morella rubra]